MKLGLAPEQVLAYLWERANIRQSETSFDRIAAIASTLRWTRDPFDRIIVAHAMADSLPLLTNDPNILANCPLARWD